MRKFGSIIFVSWMIIQSTTTSYAQTTSTRPVRLAVAGLTHGHVRWILGRKGKNDIELAGIYESNIEVCNSYAREFNIPKTLFYSDLKTMLDSVKPEAVVAFGSIYQHLAVVEACAPRHIHVMVEKPLAVSNDHVNKMAALAKKYGIFLLTNYETSWYPTTPKSFQLINDSNSIGHFKKAVFHHGHQGPKEIGVQKEFFDWLTDPVQNGGGALVDFGCYGANIMTWLMKGEEPVSVTAVTKQFKPSIYPKVDDDAIIVVTYAHAEAIIQASWNWPFGRKDMELYGDSGYIIAKNKNDYNVRTGTMSEKQEMVNEKDIDVYTDPFSYFADVIRGKIKVPAFGLYSIENNVMVVHILDAARRSAKEGKTIRFSGSSAAR
jgi:predicted dehydrogenase